MWRALRFITIAVLFLLLAWWIGGIPGTFTARSGAYTVQTTVPMAILLMVLIAIILTALFRVLGGLRRAPGGINSWRGGRRGKLGEIATQRGIVALAAGDAKAAATQAGRARRLLGETPLVLLLTAESARLSGDTARAQMAFGQLTRHKDMAFLGHRGLLRHHAAAGDHDLADTHADAAEAAYPGAAWLKTQRLGISVNKQDYAAALAHTRKPSEIAALASGAAGVAGNDRDALAYAKKAIKADPALAPAIVAYATILRKMTRNRSAKKALLKGWTTAPHPLIADAYLARANTPIERAQAAGDLAVARPGHPETEILLAETALAAQLTGEAKRHADAALAAGLTDRRPYVVLAALGDPAAAAIHAPAPTWSCTACFTETPNWTPACPNCAKPGTLIWKTGAGRGLVKAAN